MQLRRGGVQRRGPHPHQRLHLLQAAGPRGGRAAHPLLQPQVRVRGALQHRHSPPNKYTQDNVRKGHQGEKIGNIFLYLWWYNTYCIPTVEKRKSGSEILLNNKRWKTRHLPVCWVWHIEFLSCHYWTKTGYFKRQSLLVCCCCWGRWPDWPQSRMLCSTLTTILNCILCSAWNEGYPNVPEDFTITVKAPTRPFSWLKAPTSAFTFKTLLRHYAKRALTPR